MVQIGCMLGDYRNGYSMRNLEKVIIPKNENVETFLQREIKSKHPDKSLFYWMNAQWNKL